MQRGRSYENDIIIILVILFVGLISFGLGRLSALSEQKTPVVVENLTSAVGNTSTLTSDVDKIDSITEKLYVVSKNGTKYHYPWCSGAQRIKEENKIWFSTKEEVERAGYTPAANCKGL